MSLTLARVRARSLQAVGLVIPAAVLAACNEPPPKQASPSSSASSALIPVATGSLTPASDVSTSGDSIADASVVADARTPMPYPRRMPSCPSGAFCAQEPATRPKPPEAAAAPYQNCALTGTDPSISADAGGGFPRRNVTFSAENTARERTTSAKACCYTWVIPCPGGRAFRDVSGEPRVAAAAPREDWVAALSLTAEHLHPDERARLADRWLRDAAFEHASVASFAQLTLDLLAVGAPPELLALTQQAALDEIEHAKIAFALARIYSGITMGPGALRVVPAASGSLADLVRKTFADACIGESVASFSLAEEANEVRDPALRALLETMAEDELRHAELAWRILAWAVTTGDTEARRVLDSALVDLEERLLRGAETGRTADVLRAVVLPCLTAIVGGSTPASSATRDALVPAALSSCAVLVDPSRLASLLLGYRTTACALVAPCHPGASTGSPHELRAPGTRTTLAGCGLIEIRLMRVVGVEDTFG